MTSLTFVLGPRTLRNLHNLFKPHVNEWQLCRPAILSIMTSICPLWCILSLLSDMHVYVCVYTYTHTQMHVHTYLNTYVHITIYIHCVYIYEEDFIPDYCNRRGRLNSTSLKQKTGGFSPNLPPSLSPFPPAFLLFLLSVYDVKKTYFLLILINIHSKFLHIIGSCFPTTKKGISMESKLKTGKAQFSLSALRHRFVILEISHFKDYDECAHFWCTYHTKYGCAMLFQHVNRPFFSII